MKITCIKSGGFMGQEQSCIIDSKELNPSEQEAFEQLITQSRKDEEMRDSYVYYFNFEANNTENEVILEETYIEESMMPFIRKVNNKLSKQE